MSRIQRDKTLGAEEARQQLPAVLSAAAAGRTTIITRHGKAIAAVVPIAQASGSGISLAALAGTGRGFWGKDSRRHVRMLRDEWTN